MTEREKLIEELFSTVRKIPFTGDAFGAIADFILSDRKRIVQPLVEALEAQEEIGPNEGTAPAWQRLDNAAYETIKLAGLDKETKTNGT